MKINMLSALALCLLAASVYAQQTYTPLPIICTKGGSAGAAISTCASEKYDIPAPTDLVRWCNKKTAQCTTQEMTLAQWAILADAELVDGCRDPALRLGEIDHSKCLDWEQLPKYYYPKQDYFTGAPTSGQAPLTVLLKWAVANGATSCLASNGWTGNKGTQGEETVVAAASTSYKLDCTSPSSNGAALVKWTPPTQNVDGSTLSNLAGFRVQYGTSSTVLNQIIEVPNPSATQFNVDNLAPGKWYFTVTAYTSNGLESLPSNTASKDVAAVAGVTFSHTIAVTVTNPAPKPKPPTNVTVTTPPAATAPTPTTRRAPSR